MVHLIAQINPHAGKEKVVYDKLNEVFNFPIITKIEQLSDFYIVFKFCPENVEKMRSIQDAEGVLNIKLIPADVIIENNIDIEQEGHYIVFIQTEVGKREQTMNKLLSIKDLNIYHAAYFFDDRADILLEIVSSEDSNAFIDLIRQTEGVKDTVLYNLPSLKATTK